MAEPKKTPARMPETVLSDEQHEQNKTLLLEMEMEELKRENERLKQQAVFAPKVAAQAPVVDLTDLSDPAFNAEGDPDELLLVEAVRTGTAPDHDRPGRPNWAHVRMEGRREEGGTRYPGRVFRMRRAEIVTCMYHKGSGTGWVRVLRPGEQLRADIPLGPTAPQTTQFGAKLTGNAFSGALPIGT